MNKEKKTYFLSDVHLGVNTDLHTSKEREAKLIKFLEEIKKDADSVYLMGDIFDFWFEYKYVVPKGYVRFLNKLTELTDAGINVNFFKGNHDMWTFGYLEKELGVKVFDKPCIINLNENKFFIAHGDGLGPYDKSYNFLKRIFRNSFFQFIFKIVHPDIGMYIANSWSSSSRKKHKYPKSIKPENEWLVKYAKTVLEKDSSINYFVFGHRHIPFQYQLDDNSVFTNLGDWLSNFSYAVFDGKELKLLTY